MAMNDALLSPCGTYRYTLGRELSTLPEIRLTPTFTLRGEHKPCLFIMLNPSTADASLDDPTIRRCMGFALREGCTFLTVVNLFAYRATEPKDLVGEYQMGTDIVGPENLTHVSRELRRHNPNLGHLIIAAWGAHPYAEMAHEIRAKVRNAGALCLGTTKGGEPRHPLYLKSDAPLVPWMGTP
jgi:hypothetical protein